MTAGFVSFPEKFYKFVQKRYLKPKLNSYSNFESFRDRFNQSLAYPNEVSAIGLY